MMLWLWLLARLLLLDSDDSDGQPPNGGDGDGNEEIKDPPAKIAALQDQVNRLHRRLKERDTRIEELEAQSAPDELRPARLEAAFLRAVMNHEDRVVDIETAWELATAKGYLDPVKNNGEGMEDALGRLLERYPYLAGEEAEPTPEHPAPTVRSGSPLNSRRQPSAAASQAAMEQRFPALRRRR